MNLSRSRGRITNQLSLLKKTLIQLSIIFMVAAGTTVVEHKMAGTVANAQEQARSQAIPIAGFSYADLVSRVSPAVVTIHSEIRTREAQQFPFSNDPLLDQLFGQGRSQRRQQQQAPTERKEQALGSGVVVSPDGYILTNHHVVDGAQRIQVDLNDNRTVDAKLVGSDAPSDLALLKVDASDLPVLPLGNSDAVRVGDVVLAIGNPLGVGKTVTMGIISAKGRQTGLSNGSFEDFLQTDAPINQGNSGGALVSTNGELVGINSQILSRSGGSIGIGFAIPSNMARDVFNQLKTTGKVRRGQLGIVVQKVSGDIAASLNLKEAHGVIVSEVQAGSAADRAGVKQGDIITALNGTQVDEPNTFRNTVAGTRPGAPVTLSILRNGEAQQIRATLGEFKAEAESSDDNSTTAAPARPGNAPKLGIGVQPITPDVAKQYEIPAGTSGLVVGQVDPNGAAADAGIQEGDVILQVNGQPVRAVTELLGAVNRTGTRPALFLVNRRGQTVYITVKPHA